MWIAKLEIKHIGCWGSEISLKFPELSFSSVDCRWIKNLVSHLLLAKGDSRKFDDVFQYLKEQKMIKFLEVLSRENEKIYIRTLSESEKKHPHFSYMFFENGCILSAPTFFQRGYEIYTLEAAKKENIMRVYNKIKKRYSVNIVYIKENKFTLKLTAKQREILIFAKHFGYYEWPRRKSASDIAKIVKIPKTVFLSHLRKAEKKIIEGFFEEEDIK